MLEVAVICYLDGNRRFTVGHPVILASYQTNAVDKMYYKFLLQQF